MRVLVSWGNNVYIAMSRTPKNFEMTLGQKLLR
jgi:hypothetical protein